MDIRINQLKEWGCDTDGALDRVLKDEAFYFECLQDLIESPVFEELKDTLESHDKKNAFEAAHKLKGILLNLGLTPMCEVIVKIVEPLRVGNDDNLKLGCEQLLSMRQRIEGIINLS